jgi:hypothetical protein
MLTAPQEDVMTFYVDMLMKKRLYAPEGVFRPVARTLQLFT